MESENETLQAIQEHIQTAESGTATVVFENNSIGRIYLDAGEPVFAMYKGLEGREALEAFKGFGVRTVKFHAGVNIVGSKKSLEPPPPEPPPAPQSPPQPSPAPPSAPALTPEQKQVIGQILSDQIGPASLLIISELPDDISLDAAVNILVGELGDVELANDFVAQVRRILR